MDELVITIHDCLQCLRYIDQFTIADVLQEISEKRPKICCVHKWPDQLLIEKNDHSIVDLMVLVNGLIMSLNCQLVVE